MPIMVKCDKWPGESTIDGFSTYFEVSSFQFGVGRGIGSAFGGSTREGSIASVSEITFTKVTDKSSIKIFEDSLHGELDRKVEIAFVRTGAGNTPAAYITIKLEGCGISGYSISSGGDRPSESISLNFDKIEYTYEAMGDNLNGEPLKYSWDLATAKGA